jgi:general secretion pathway protein C
MKRLPLVASFLLFILLCASIAYWGLQLFKPPLRPVAAPPQAAKSDINPEAAATLFGGRAGKVAVASNYQLKGVVMSGSADESIAILSADGKPAQAVRVDAEVAPGVVVKEVHRDYVLLSDGGTVKRVELPENAKSEVNVATVSPVRPQSQPARTPVPQQAPAPAPPQVPAAVAPPAQPAVPGVPPAPATSAATAANPSVPATPAGQQMAPPAAVVSRPPSQTAAPAAPATTPLGGAGMPQQQVSPPDGAAARMQGSSGIRR